MTPPEIISESGQLIYQGHPIADVDCTIAYKPSHSWAGDFVIKKSHSDSLINLLLEATDFELELSRYKGKIIISEQNIAKINGGLDTTIVFKGVGKLVEKNKN